jgi:hypothetical protein
VFKRVAVIAALHRAGLSLAVAGRIAYFLPYHTVLFAVCDPVTLGAPPFGVPVPDWFAPDQPARADPIDWRIEIFNRRFVAVHYGTNAEPLRAFFGDLRDAATRFVAWSPVPQRNEFTGGAIGVWARQLLSAHFIAFVADWENPHGWSKELARLDYALEPHNTAADPLCLAAAATAQSPLVHTTVNVTLAIRQALRRYLGFEPAARVTQNGDER